MSAPARDDLLTGIHKALRLGLLRVTVQLGAADWADPGDRDAAGAEWQRLSGLLRSHASHEDRHIFALVEAKRPGSLAALHADHEELDLLQDQLDHAVQEAARGTAAGAGPRAYARAAAFTGRYLAHLDAEDRTVMPGIWEACSDEEIAACRAAFMAEIGPEEAAYTGAGIARDEHPGTSGNAGQRPAAPGPAGLRPSAGGRGGSPGPRALAAHRRRAAGRSLSLPEACAAPGGVRAQ
jgi:hypothetical protein